jgi:hypothetical protein
MATFTFINPSGSSYFTMETAKFFSGSYDHTVTHYASGSFNGFSGSSEDHVVQSNYIFSQVIPHGTSSFNFLGAVTIPQDKVYFRGTGDFRVIIDV